MAVIQRSFKKTMFRAFLMIEASIFLLNYFFGSQGLYALRQMRIEKKLLDVECAALHKEVNRLTAERDMKLADSFYKEKVAREQLQMAYPDEKIYYCG